MHGTMTKTHKTLCGYFQVLICGLPLFP